MTIDQRVSRIEIEISGVGSLFNITSWEKDFLRSINSRDSISPKQENILIKIEEKVFGD